METIEQQYSKVKELHTTINSYIKEFKKESDKYMNMISSSDELELSLKELKRVLELLYGETCNIEPTRFGYTVDWFDGITTNRYDDMFLPKDCIGMGQQHRDVINDIKEKCNIDIGVKLNDVHFIGQKDNPWDDAYGIQHADVVLTQKYMDSINRRKRVPSINLPR
jgi:hypothetical protein